MLDADRVTDPEKQFRELVASLARSMEAFDTIEEREDELALDLSRADDDGPKVIAYLSNLFRETRDLGPAERAARIRFFLEGVAQPEDPDLSREEALSRVFAVVRSPSLFASMPAGGAVVARRPLPCLFECVALDRGRTFSYVTEEQREGWGCSMDELFERARANVEETLEHSIEPWDVAAPYPMWHVSANDAYESSRVLAPSFLRAMKSHVTGSVVCAIPERSTLLVVGDASFDSVIRLAETAEREFMASTRGVSPALYGVGPGGEIVPYVVADDHPLASIVRRGHVLLANAEYAEQKRHLDAAHERDDVDLFVASFIATQRDAEIRTIATWSEDVDTLLPVTDLVAFVKVDDDGEPLDSFLVAWEDVERIAGGCLEEVPGLWPERRHTKRYPSADELASLRDAALPD